MFDSPEIFYFNKPKDVIFDDNWVLDYDKIAKLKDYKLVIADFSPDHYGVDGLDHVYQALDQQQVNFLLLSHDPLDHKRFERMWFYPTWYHWARKNLKTKNSQSLDKTYKWSCLNANPRNHRIYNYYCFHQKSYFHDACFTFYNGGATRADDVPLDDEVTQFWNNIKQTLPHSSTIFSNGYPIADCNLPACYDSYIQLVVETTIIEKMFVSEKTWKPIASGQLFLIFGNPGTVSYLRNQGVDVFDDLIDHSYDHTLDWKLRLHQIHQQLEILICQDLRKIYQDTRERREINRQKFLSGAFDQRNHYLEQCIKTYLQI